MKTVKIIIIIIKMFLRVAQNLKRTVTCDLKRLIFIWNFSSAEQKAEEERKTQLAVSIIDHKLIHIL